MPIVAIFQAPGLTEETYQQVCRKLTGGKKNRMESAADWPVKGIVAHVAGQSPSGFRVIDVWESEAAMGQFAATLLPLLAEIGIEGAPEVYPVFAYMSA